MATAAASRALSPTEAGLGKRASSTREPTLGRETYLGIDVGTGSTKAVLVDQQGAVLRSASARHEISSPRPGWTESDPVTWWSAVQGAVRTVTAGGDESIGAIGLSGQMHGAVLVDREGGPVRPAVIWSDQRAMDAARLYKGLPAKRRQRLGNPFVPGMTGPVLCWLAEHEPAKYAKAAWFLQAKDWVRSQLTGDVQTDPSDASGTLLYDQKAQVFDLVLMAGLGLRPELAPPVAASSSVAGALGAAASAALGLRAGLPVAVGAADTAAALLATGLGRSGGLQLTVGSGAQVVAPRESPAPDPRRRYHVFAAATPAQWYALAAVQAAGLALEWVLANLRASWEEAYTALEEVPAGSGTPVFLPHLAGSRAPGMDPHQRAVFAGVNLQHGRAHLLRAALEGVAFSIKAAASALPEFAHTAQLWLAGGGTQVAAWRQLLADSLERRLDLVAAPDASARGAAILALAAVSGSSPEIAPPAVQQVTQPRDRESRLLAASWQRWQVLDALRLQ